MQCKIIGVLFLKIFYAIISVNSLDMYAKQPKIISSDGNMIFSVPRDKNITFETFGLGSVRFNNEDLILVTNKAVIASQTVERIRNVYATSFDSLKRIENILEGSRGLIYRVGVLEGNRRNNSRGDMSTTRRYPGNFRMNRRLSAVERKISRIMSLLTQNECASNPCKNGATCQDLFGSYMCHCMDAWEGALCDKDVNECGRFAGTDLGCQNGATCINKQGSYECQCTNGWVGLHCTRKSTDCNAGSGSELCGHGTCINQNTAIGYKCICDQGWKSDGIRIACTVDVDECSSVQKPPCSTNPAVPCINVPGSYYCGSCPMGYSGNGYYCNDIDECQISNGGCSTNPKVQCINTHGSRTCGPCPPGYLGDGITCLYQGLCRIANGGCHQSATCRENPSISSTYVECICPAGFTGSGVGPIGCIQLTTKPTARPSSNRCNPNPCRNNGTCKIVDIGFGRFSWECTCPPGFTGETCKIRTTAVNPCISNPCLNGGTCKRFLTQYFYCICTTSFTGRTCNIERQACGGKLSGQSGILRYPDNNSTSYQNSRTCIWLLETLPNKVFNITFTKFQLEPSPKCNRDWLQVHDGRSSGAKLIGRYCGTSIKPGTSIVSSTNNVYVWFRSDVSVAREGFAFTWQSMSPVCGFRKSLEAYGEGTINSPGSPGKYPPNRDCYWALSAPLGQRIKLIFFSLDIGKNSNCNNDYLEVIQGDQPTHPVIAKYCNSTLPDSVTSGGPDLLLHFHSDSSNNYGGFQIAYSVIAGIPGCGGLFTLNKGEISSPSVNNRYPEDLICEYKIKLTKDWRIKLTFLSFSLEESSSCIFDYVTIREGGSPTSPLVGRYCGKKLPSIYISLANEVFITFKSDFANTEEGFRLKYESVCGGKYTSPSGILESPGYPIKYFYDAECIYEIEQPLKTSITLNVTDFAPEDTDRTQCETNGFEIRDGDNENATLIGNFCFMPSSLIISTHNYLWIKFKTDTLHPRRFRANFSTTDLACGGISKSPIGIIQTPDHPNHYPSNTNCTWKLVAPQGQVVQITWMSFETEKSASCLYDYVQVFDNNDKDGMGGSMGKFCGSTLPPTLLSSSNIVTIIFVADRSLTYDGFIASYAFRDQQNLCGGKYFTNAGVIRSPGWPSRYPTNKDCSWVISVASGQQIMLNVTTFELESYSQCRYDYLEIRNGGNAASPLIGKYCGNTIPANIPTHANQVYIRFRSDMTKVGAGFEIYWESATTGCGGVLSSPRGTIISPNYPQAYGRNTECYWKIYVNTGSLVQIIFSDLDLEANPACRMDYVELYDGEDINGNSLGRYCSSIPHFLISSSNHMSIKFRSDLSYQGRGFQIQYNTICNNTLSGFRGVIESPNFPNGYPHEQHCAWKISAPIGNKINITFSHFQLEKALKRNNGTCIYDYVKITEGKHDDLLLDEFCGDIVPDPISSTTNLVTIYFETDSILTGNGFRLEWVIDGCGGILTRPTGEIMTPNYPKRYPEEMICYWSIQVDYGKSIQITFDYLDLEDSVECYYDYVTIYNGKDDSYPLLSKLCHVDNKPITITSSGNFMYVYFKSDYSASGKGFKAKYKTVSTDCGGLFTAPKGAIHSKNYPKNYDKKDVCVWLIQQPANHMVALTFTDLDLFDKTCKTESVTIYDGDNMNSTKIASYCGNKTPNETIYSTSNVMLVVMKTSSVLAAKGFLANYSLACGSRIETDSNGIIELPPHHQTMNCSWTIIAKNPDQHVSLTITHLQLVEECYPPPLKIFNGLDSTAPLISSHCGNRAPPTIVSDGSALHITLLPHNSIFVASYSALSNECGGDLSSMSGLFSTPNYPLNYPYSTECEWTLKTSPGNGVSVSFRNFDILESPECNSDYVEIRQNNSMGKLLGTFCGKTVPSNLTISDSFWILFHSSEKDSEDNAAITANGFLAEYDLVFDNELKGDYGQIASPFYPKLYQENKDTTWRITVDFGYKISINFLDFYIYSQSSEMCFIPALQIYDGFDDTAPLIKELCGVYNPDPIKSSSNMVFIKLEMSSLSRGINFLLEWRKTEHLNRVITLNKLIKTNSNICGTSDVIDLSVLRNYTLKSPGYPNGYENNLMCEWIFSTTTENHLAIEFYNVNLETSTKICIMDYVEIFSGKDGTADWQSLGKVCFPNATYNKIHSSNLMKVVFRTDLYVNKTGFHAAVFTACGGTLKKPSGIIAVNNETLLSQANKQISCEWNITVKAGRKIEVQFLNINIPEREDTSGRICKHYYVMLKNGHSSESPILENGKYCGSELPGRMITSGNALYIKYLGLSFEKGFSLRYQEVSLQCGGTITLSKEYNTTIIASPNYPLIPPPYTECIWLITAPPGESLRIDFLERFDFTTRTGCSAEALELRDGGTISSPLMGRYCEDLPSSKRSTGNMLYIKFFTEVTDPKNGFKAQISLSKCGALIRANSGRIQSLNLHTNQQFPKNMECSWKIITTHDHYLVLNFDVLNLIPATSNCTTTNHVTITEINKINNTERLIGSYCGKDIPPAIKTSTNEVTVKFQSRGLNNKGGFSLKFMASQEECGGNMNAESGYIQSPGYPRTNHYSRSCEWVITVPASRRITLEILDLDLNGVDFMDQILGVFNGKFRSNSNISPIITYRASEKPSTLIVKSSSNVMTVYFWSSHVSNHRGFKAKYTSDEPTICQGDFNQPFGEIAQPTENVTTYYCVWERFAADQSSLSSTTLAMKIRSLFLYDNKWYGSQCKFSPSSIRFSAENSKYLLYEYCDRDASTTTIRSPFPKNTITAVKTRHATAMNYTISYKTYDCGGIVRSSQGYVTSPNYPNDTVKDWECVMLLTLPEEQAIKLTFDTVEMDNSCEKEYLIIHNGALPTSPKIGKFCGNRNPPNVIQSEGNSLWFEYHKDGGNGKGFNFTYEPIISSGCGGIFHDTSRIIQTPLYPNQYPNNTECIWEIHAVNGFHITLEFINRFQLEQSANCSNDYLELMDNVDDNWISLGKFCGREVPKIFNSTTSKMKIIFRSNENTNGAGFKAKWRQNCGGTFSAVVNPRYIVSPGYPREYTGNLTCNYTIVTSQQYIDIQFQDFALEAGSICRYDNLTITGKTTNRQRLLTTNTYCGLSKPPNSRYVNVVYIIFKTDKWLNKKGFMLSYSLDSCSKLITKPGIIASPILYSNYGERNCYWNVTAPEGMNIVLKFRKLELEYHERCLYDYIEVFDGLTTNASKRLSKLCHNLNYQPPVLKSTGNGMVIHMRTDFSNHYPGFESEILFVYGTDMGCGGKFNVTTDISLIIKSPDIQKTGEYVNGLDCHWLIHGIEDTYLKIEFDSFHLATCTDRNETNQNCSCDYLEVYDGRTAMSEMITRNCGHTKPLSSFTSSNHVFIRFVTDGYGTSTGFKITITAIPSPCGPSILTAKSEKQTLSSPNFPDVYPLGINCRWKITSQFSTNKYDIHFKFFDLHNASTLTNRCERDKLEFTEKYASKYSTDSLGSVFIFNGAKNQPTLVPQTFCGTKVPAIYYTSSNELSIKFVSDSVEAKTGFSIEYKLLGCNRNFTSSNGRIFNERLKGNCSILITVPEKSTISIYFYSFLVANSGNCIQSGIEILDGNNETAPQLLKACGYQLPKTVFSTSNVLTINVWNTFAHNFGIYDMTYTSTDKGRGCGGSLFNAQGRFTSPMYPNNYRNESECVWNIEVPTGLMVVLKFNEFNIGTRETCATDYLKVTYPKMDGSQWETKFCGDDNPSIIKSEKNTLNVIYKTSMHNAGNGWIAVYVATNQDVPIKAQWIY